MRKQEATSDLLAGPIWRLKAMGAWPYFGFGEIFILPTLIIFCAQVAFLCTTADLDSTTIFRVATEIFAIYLSGLKAWYTYRNAKKVYESRDFILNEMKIYETHLPLKSRKIEKRRAAVAKAVCLVIAYLTTGLFYMAIISAIMSILSDDRDTRQFVILLGPESFVLKTNFGFITFGIVFSAHIYFTANGFIAFDTLYVVSCHYISSKSMKLCHMLEEIQQHVKSTSHAVNPFPLRVEDVLPKFGIDGEKLLPATELNFRGWSGDRHDEEILYAALIRCVKYHQKIRWLRNKAEEICSIPILNTMIGLVLHLVMPIVRVLLFGVEDRGGYAFFAFYILWSYFNLVHICLWADQVTEQSEEVADAAFSIYSSGMCSERIRVALELMILGAQRPLYLSAAGLFKISAQKLLDVAKQSWSLMTFVLKVRK